ncbi:MAG TPA: complex I NDUFA9 subunit family protein [Azospirillaceae bacterium]|nr:complex I NDUFA9 subunit family protein [Azospirillaceae bacterium]
MVYRYRVATVFGASGFIGRHLVRRLAKTGCVIRVVSRHPSGAGFLRTNGAVGQIVPMGCDVRSEESIRAAVQGADLVVNLIGILAESRRYSFQAVQAEAAGRIARVAKQAGVARFVQMSALGADAASGSRYARSKAEGERLVREAFPEATLFRPSIVFGPEDGFFNRFARMAMLSPALPLIGGGHTKFQPVYVGDVADAIMNALSTPESQGRTYELVGPRTYTFRELMQLVLSQTGRRNRLVSLPWGLAKVKAAFLELLPWKPLTRDQVELLKADNVASGKEPGLAELGVLPTAAEVILPTYMDQYRVGGRFSMQRNTGSRTSLSSSPAPETANPGRGKYV